LAEEVVWRTKNGKCHGSHHRKLGGVGLAVPAALLNPCAAEPVGHVAYDVRKGLASQVDQEIKAVGERPRRREALTPTTSSTGLAVCGWTALRPADRPTRQAMWAGWEQATTRVDLQITSAPRAMKARGARAGRGQRAQLTEF
jgi:hypothetical protein